MFEEKIDAQDTGSRCALIKWVTENGYSIVRSCDVGEDWREHRFVVRNPNGWEREVIIEFDPAAVELAQRRRRSPLSPRSSFWVNCAERSLATYLWERDQYPPNGRLILEELCLDDLEAARCWNSD
jgi:hypothetical protein